MTTPKSVEVVEICQVLPTFNPNESDTEFSLPLTFLDVFWLKFPQVRRLFFYQLTESTPQFFNSVILPKLKHSLSLTLRHFLPVAGQLTWPHDSPTPIILYTPGDGIQLTVAESNDDMDRISNNGVIEAVELHPYVPELPVSETKSSAISLQITLFPNKGFSVGYCLNHSVLDGKSISMVMKAWSYISKHDTISLLPTLVPFYDRSTIKDPSELQRAFLSQWEALTEPESKTNPRNLKLLPSIKVSKDLVRSTFVLTREDINNLKNKVSSELKSSVCFSSFVVTCAYVTVCLVKAKGGDINRKFWFVFNVDCRARLDPPLEPNYFGNCIATHDIITEASDLMAQNGVSIFAERLNEKIKGLEKGRVLEGIEFLSKLKSLGGIQSTGVGGSPRLEVYGCDFGWGRPKKVDIVSIDNNGGIALNESKDGNGIEIGLVKSSHEMEVFSSLFVGGLKDL